MINWKTRPDFKYTKSMGQFDRGRVTQYKTDASFIRARRLRNKIPLRFMSWTFQKNARMWDTIRDYGFRMDKLGVFEFLVDVTGTIYCMKDGAHSPNMQPQTLLLLTNRIGKWPHIEWFLNVRNDGVNSIFVALINNTNGARDKFLTEITRILDQYPWCAGIDLDFEAGGQIENMPASKILFTLLANLIHSRSTNNLFHADLPAMTSFTGSIGGENWCDYGFMDTVLDSCVLMSYGFAWAGSAPGPTSPKWWMVQVYNYAVTVLDPRKVMMGIPGFGWRWQIDHIPVKYRAVSQTYYAALSWLEGLFNHTGDGPPQPFLYADRRWEEVNGVPWALLHVYDYKTAANYRTISTPLVDGVYGHPKKEYVTAYAPVQKVTIEGQEQQFGPEPSSYSETGIVVGVNDVTITGAEGWGKFDFYVYSAGTYDLAVRLTFPWFGKSALDFVLNDTTYTLKVPAIWYPLYRFGHYMVIPNVALSAGDNSVTVMAGQGSIVGAKFHHCIIAAHASVAMTSGDATYDIDPRPIEDVNGNLVTPATAYKMTAEVLRRIPDSALIWYEDYKDYGTLEGAALPSFCYSTISGSWLIYADSESYRPYSWVEGSGEYRLDYTGFNEVHVNARILIPSGSGKAGVYFGDLYLCLNIDTQRVELYQDADLIQSYSTTITHGVGYLLQLRVRGTNCRVYSGPSSVFRFSSAVSPQTGAVGIRSDMTIKSDYLRIGDAWYYEPSEQITITMPVGGTTSFGRIERTGVTWDTTWNIFKVDTDVEEATTRTDAISMDYDYFHSAEMQLESGKEYTATVTASDKGVWLSSLYLGDADGFSIMYYVDGECIRFLLRLDAENKWRLMGWGLWALGQEDVRMWAKLPNRVSNPYALPTGYPRQFLDGLNEFAPFFKHGFDGEDTDLTLSGATIGDDVDWFRPCLDCSTGRAFLPAVPEQVSGWGPKTIFIWIKPTTDDVLQNDTWRIIATQRAANNYGVHFAIYNGGLNVRGYDTLKQNVFNSTTSWCPLVANAWQLVSLQFQTDFKYSIFHNGLAKRSAEPFSINSNIATHINGWEFGKMNDAYPYTGKIGGMFIVQESWLADQQLAYYNKVFVERKL